MTESKTSPRRIEAIERQKQALDLRKAGATYDAIAKKLEYANGSGAEHAVKAALKATIQDSADDVRRMELERLDALLLQMWTQTQKGNLGAVDRVLRIMERRSKLLGLDAPTKQEIAVTEVVIRRVSGRTINTRTISGPADGQG